MSPTIIPTTKPAARNIFDLDGIGFVGTIALSMIVTLSWIVINLLKSLKTSVTLLASIAAFGDPYQ